MKMHVVDFFLLSMNFLKILGISCCTVLVCCLVKKQSLKVYLFWLGWLWGVVSVIIIFFITYVFLPI